MKTSAELWAMIEEFGKLEDLMPPTRASMARQLSIAEHLQEWLEQHRGAADSMDDYHLGQTAAMCVVMAPSREAVRHGPYEPVVVRVSEKPHSRSAIEYDDDDLPF